MSSDYDERANLFWSIYVKEAEQDDKNMTESWKSDMDSTLIFAGLFSATVTAFIIESYKLLRDDSEAAVKDLLTQMLAFQIVGASLNTSVISLPTNVPAASAFHPPLWAIAVNILWFLSLTSSLAAALCVTLVQQWTRDYLQRIQRTNQPQRHATIRGVMFSGTEKWKMNDVVEYIPILLHISLFLFFVGLCTFLFNVNVATAGVVLAITVCCLAFYGLATIAPLIDPSAPYETPFSSLLWHAIPRQAGPMIPAGPRSLSEVRERLASPPDRQSLHRRIHAVSWVYDRTTDDLELQELVTSITGLLSSQDGQIAWKDFLDQSSGAIHGLEARIIRLLMSCSSAGYLDKKSRQLRATSCVDALLAICLFPDFLRTSSTAIMNLYGIIKGSWDDDGILATKSICAQLLFNRRARVLEIQRMKSFLENGFRELSNEADQALRDIDDMRQILEDVLRESGTSAIPIQMYKTDVANLLRLYFALVAAKTSVLQRWATDMRIHIGHPLPLLSFYHLMPPAGLRIKYTSALAPTEEIELVLDAYQMLAYLRFHGAYPSIPETSGALSSSMEGSLKTWFPVTEGFVLGQTARTFRPFDPTERLTGNSTTTNFMLYPINPNSSNYHGICRELQPISELLDTLDASPATTVTVAANNFNNFLWGDPRRILPHSLVPQTIQAEKRPRSVALMLEAVIEDVDYVGGLFELMTALKSYSLPTRIFNSSIISQSLDYIFPPLSHFTRRMSTGSQILFVGVLREILDWEHHPNPEHQALFPFCDADIQRLCELLMLFNHELPVAMAEHALGTTLDSPDAIASANLSERAFQVYWHVMDDRKRTNATSPVQGESQQNSL